VQFQSKITLHQLTPHIKV